MAQSQRGEPETAHTAMKRSLTALPEESRRLTRRAPIASRLLVAFVLAAMIPTSLAVAITLIVAQREIRKEVTNNLNAVADGKVDRVESYTRLLRKDVSSLARTVLVLDTLRKLEVAREQGIAHPTFLDQVATARVELSRLTSDLGYDDLFLLDPNGVELIAIPGTDGQGSSSRQIPHDRSELDRVFRQTRVSMETELGNLIRLPGAQSPSAYIASPVIHHGQLAGVVALRVGNSKSLRIIQDPTSLGATGETVVGFQRGKVVLVTEPSAASSQRSHGMILSIGSLNGRAIQAAASGATGSGLSTDFRGHEVLAAWRYLPSLRSGLVVQIDSSEAFASARRLYELVMGIVLLTLVVAMVASMLVARSLSRPIVRLTEVAHEVALGDLTREVNVDGPKEIVRLGRAFNLMTTQLRDLYGSIEDQVRERTEQLLATEQKVTYLLNASAEAIYAIDIEGICTFCNPACVRLLGFGDESELIGQPIHTLIYGNDSTCQAHSTECPIMIGMLKAENQHADDDVFWRADRTSFAVEYWAHPLFDRGETVGAVINFLDVAERRQSRAMLMAAKDAAEEANRTKSQFLANMSHELRTPLNAVIGYSELLQEEAEDGGQPHFIPDLKKIQSAGTHLLELINAVLDLSKIEAGKVEVFIEDLDPATLCQEVVALAEPIARKNANAIRMIVPQGEVGPIRADVMKLRQCLINLLSNACKFTDHGEITLKIVRDIDDDGMEWMDFEVHDTGIGLDAHQMANLFQAFSQADASTTRKYGGTGLGLVISRRFCQLMGGDITMSSEPGVGSRFVIRIPTAVNDPRRPIRDVIEVPDLSQAKGTVLVIDDDVNVHQLLRKALAREGFLVETASTGREGLKHARALHPDAITLDVMLANGDGWAVFAELKSDPELAEIPVVLMTIVDHQNHAFRLGAAEFLTKPIDRKQLHNLMKKYDQWMPNARVLVVEDDRTTRTLSRKMLESEGYHVDEAENGRVALAYLEDNLPDLILLDLGMPEMNGFELVEALLADQRWRNIPTVVVTARDLAEADRRRLTGTVSRILQVGNHLGESSLEEVGHLVASVALQSRHSVAV